MVIRNLKAAAQRKEKTEKEKKKDKTLRKAQPTSQPIYPSWHIV
jgi:hypothetical protein